MGWLEFVGWLNVMRKQQEGERADPGSWTGAENDAAWHEMRQARERAYGRG